MVMHTCMLHKYFKKFSCKPIGYSYRMNGAETVAIPHEF